MFDDQNVPQNPVGVPGNLPIGEPDDMFGSVDPTTVTPPTPSEPIVDDETIDMGNTALRAGVLQPKKPITSQNNTDSLATSGGNQPADMFAPVDPVTPSMTPPPVQDPAVGGSFVAPTPPVSPPVSPQMPPVSEQPHMTVPPAQINPQDALYSISEPIGSKKTLVWIITVIVIVVLGLGGAWIYFTLVKPQQQNTFDNTTSDTPSDNIFDETPTIPESVIPNVSEPEVTTPEDVSNQILLGEPLDTDGDGLDDVREEGIRTNPLNWDTDGDGLSDGDEVTIWKTDPLNSDTDGDSFSDGTEIKNGYSPTGSGKLFQPPTTTTQ